MTSLQLHGVIEKDVRMRETAPAHDIVSFDAFDAVISDYKLGADTAETPPEILASAALDHHQILSAYCADFALLPTRFGSVFSGIEALGNVIHAQGCVYIEALRVLADHREYSIELVSNDAPARPDAPQTTGRDFLNHRLQARDKRRGVSQIRRQFAQSLEGIIASLAAQPPNSSTSNSEKLLDLRALFSPSAVQHLSEMAVGIETEAASLGLGLQIKGPWPAYHFVTHQSENMVQRNGS